MLKLLDDLGITVLFFLSIKSDWIQKEVKYNKMYTSKDNMCTPLVTLNLWKIPFWFYFSVAFIHGLSLNGGQWKYKPVGRTVALKQKSKVDWVYGDSSIMFCFSVCDVSGQTWSKKGSSVPQRDKKTRLNSSKCSVCVSKAHTLSHTHSILNIWTYCYSIDFFWLILCMFIAVLSITS